MCCFFFFNDTATTEIYTLSLHDALPISFRHARIRRRDRARDQEAARRSPRSEEHTSELQSQSNLVCRLLLEKKKKKHTFSSSLLPSSGSTSSPPSSPSHTAFDRTILLPS